MQGIKTFLLLVFLALGCLLVAAKDYYEILDVPRDAPKSQIKRHFKKLSRVYHPDKNSGDEKASQKFMEIANAYEILMDDEKRSIYDRYGEEGLKQSQNGGRGGGGGFDDPFDIFSHFFGGGGHRHHGRHQEKRGPDMNVRLEVTLEDLYNGAEIDIDLSKQVLCDHCHGSGARRPEDIDTCDTCHGNGVIIKRAQMGPGMFQQFQQVCHACGGKGKVIRHVCPACAGKKVRRGNENYSIHIEKGMMDGQSIVLEEEADEYPEHIAGNIVFTTHAAPHPVFERKGHHLYIRQHITLIEALGGFKKTITQLDGSTIELVREGVTQYGYVQTIQGQGMPHHDNPSEHGDLFVEYQVIFPTHVDNDTLEYLKKGSTFASKPHLVHQEL
ncbi:DnaJ subfamily A member 1 [Choanephora cucurbitarum]|uniref:DnaJ subfamily A member 1 n=1 Tax=Choanephora cucurbitarum TaxID=101091 RepID=A0A1C7N0U8_9FUNG|nr:DnaJ subfamily A member 1 [Choanephora cucurbitarum]